MKEVALEGSKGDGTVVLCQKPEHLVERFPARSLFDSRRLKALARHDRISFRIESPLPRIHQQSHGFGSARCSAKGKV